MTPHKIVMYGLGILGWAAAALALSGFLTAYQNIPAQPYHFARNPTLSADSLIIEPQDSMAPVLNLIANASSSIDLVMYELQDQQIEDSLVTAKERGVAVRVLLSGGYYGNGDTSGIKNQDAYNFLQKSGVPVKWSPNYFALTHQKTIAVDGSEAMIMTFNFTPKYYVQSRDFGIIDRDISDVSAIENTFNSDWSGSRGGGGQGDDLLWSPGSEAALVSLINSATSTLEIYNEEMADPAATDALIAAAERGVEVEIVMTDETSWKKDFISLVQAGASVRTFTASAPVSIHAKMILVDGREGFVGSQNFSATSLEKNRELGIVFDEPTLIHSLETIFAEDYANARPFVVAQ